MAAGEQRCAQRDSDNGRGEQPESAAEVNPAPVLHDDDERNGGGQQHGERSRLGDGDHQRKQRHRDESFAEAEGGADKRGEEQDEQQKKRVRTHPVSPNGI